MPTILIVEKNGNVKPVSSKNIVETDFYKKAGFKSNDGFSKHTIWKLNIDNTDYHIALYGKINGRANQENKYEFPPPVDSVLFFGNCVLANIVEGEIRDLDVDEWEVIYEYLYGGFEDVDEDDEEEEMDTDDELEAKGLEKTKDGYAKDGFIVDDDEESFADDDEEEEDDSSSESSAPKKTRGKRAPATTPKKSPKHAFTEPSNEKIDAYLDCTSELSEDSYDM